MRKLLLACLLAVAALVAPRPSAAAITFGTPVYVDSATARSTTYTASSVTNSASGHLLAVMVQENAGNSNTVTSNPSLTWTCMPQSAFGPNYTGQVQWCWAANTGSFSGTVTNTMNNSGSGGFFAVIPVQGAATTPIGQHTEVSTTTSAAEAWSVTSTAGNYLLIAGQDGWNQTVTAASGSTAMHSLAIAVPSDTAIYGFLMRTTSATTAGTNTVGSTVNGGQNSLAAVEVLTAGGATAAAPTANPTAGTYSSAQSVTLSCTETSPTITYCTGASCTPSTTYTSAISVPSSTTIGATCATAGKATSAVAYFTYTISATQAATPTFNPTPGTFTATQSVTLACTTPSSTIYYTTNGTTPTHSSSVYGAAISVPSTTTINAICAASGLTDSSVASGTFTIGAVTDFYSQNCPSLWATKTPLRVAPSGAQPTNYLSSTNVNDLQAALITLCQKLHTIETRVAALEGH